MRRLVLALSILLAACSRAHPDVSTISRAVAADSGGAVQDDRLLARHASLDVEVAHVDSAQRRAAAIVEGIGGIVQRMEVHSDDRAELFLRVPAASLDSALGALARLGREQRRVVGTDDVTETVVDLDARVTNLRALRDRLRQHLERATTVADVVAVERELARVQGQLDALETRLRTERGRVAMSEVHLTLSRRVVLGPLGVVLVGAAQLVGKLFVWR